MIKFEQAERVFNVVVSHQSDLSVDLETSAAHATLYRTKHAMHREYPLK